jgi:hypothetical protein
LNQRPTAYEAVALPLSYRGDATSKTIAIGVAGAFLACYRCAAKPLRNVNSCSTSWPQVSEAGERGIKTRRRHKELERRVSDIRTDPQYNTTEIEMIEAKERWSEYRLSDGTTLRLKPVMIAIFRADGQYTPDGEPVYNMKSTLITDVRAPASLIKSG